jgi:hypothetical protein
LNQNLSLYVLDNRGNLFFTKFKIGLNQFGIFLQFLQEKIRKEKEKRIRKEEEGRRQRFGLDPETAHSPAKPPPELVPSLLSHSH